MNIQLILLYRFVCKPMTLAFLPPVAVRPAFVFTAHAKVADTTGQMETTVSFDAGYFIGI